MSRLGKWIRSYRANNNLSQLEFAQRIGVTHTYISKLERGTYRGYLSEGVASSIAQELRIDIDNVYDLMNQLDARKLEAIARKNPTASRVLRRIQKGEFTQAHLTKIEKLLEGAES